MHSERFTPRFGGLYRSLFVNVVLPLAVVQILTHRGTPLLSALATSAIFPIAWSIFEAVKKRKLDIIAAISLLFIIGGVLASLFTHDPRLALAKESFGTGLLGAVCLGSLLAPRPLMFYFGREFATAGDPTRQGEWDQLWQAAPFRSVQRTLTVVWGVTWLAEASLRFIMAYTLAPSLTLLLSPLLAVATTIVLIAWTIAFARRAQRRRAAR
ncbi:MAG TPA: VC0807 family protein [Candidatus Binatia bacterium]|nr:VC0807 family protein [Candidatus Binatia bacterium]